MALTIDCVSTLHLSTVHHGTRLGFGGPTGRGWRRSRLVTAWVGLGKYGDKLPGKRGRFNLHELLGHSTGSPACLISRLSHIRSPAGSP